MPKIDPRFYEDKAMRDAARANFLADFEHAKFSLSGKGLAGRIVDRVGEGAQDVFEVAKTQADDNRGVISALIGAILLWFAREPIMEILGLRESDDLAEPESEETIQSETESAPLPTAPHGEHDD